MGLFKSQKEKERLSHVNTLLALAFADGKLEKNEITAIAAFAARENVDVEEVQKMLDGKDNVNFIPPQSEEDKVQYLHDLVLLMIADGNINEKEYALCKAVADQFGYREEVIDALLKKIIDDIQNS